MTWRKLQTGSEVRWQGQELLPPRWGTGLGAAVFL